MFGMQLPYWCIASGHFDVSTPPHDWRRRKRNLYFMIWNGTTSRHCLVFPLAQKDKKNLNYKFCVHIWFIECDEMYFNGWGYIICCSNLSPYWLPWLGYFLAWQLHSNLLHFLSINHITCPNYERTRLSGLLSWHIIY